MSERLRVFAPHISSSNNAVYKIDSFSSKI